MQADVRQIQHLTDVLKVFGAASGLDVNYYKSSHIPINIEDIIQTLTASLQWQVGDLPFTYLGLPLSTTKPMKEFFLPLIQCIQRILHVCTMYLNYGSKLRMVTSVISSFSMFYLFSLKIYWWVLTEVNKYRRHCLWRDKDL
jgi:hypothetical protein